MLYSTTNSWLQSSPPKFTLADRRELMQRRQAQMLLLSTTGREFPAAVRALAPYDADFVRGTVIRAGPIHLHAWLLSLSFAKADRPGSATRS